MENKTINNVIAKENACKKHYEAMKDIASKNKAFTDSYELIADYVDIKIVDGKDFPINSKGLPTHCKNKGMWEKVIIREKKSGNDIFYLVNSKTQIEVVAGKKIFANTEMETKSNHSQSWIDYKILSDKDYATVFKTVQALVKACGKKATATAEKKTATATKKATAKATKKKESKAQ